MSDQPDPFRDQDHGSAPMGRTALTTGTESSHLGASKLGDFQILREIGRGGTSIVYEAQQVSLRRKVALKRLPSAAMFDERWLKRFQNEVQTAAQLNHSNIVAFFDTGHDDDSCYYTMQLVAGISWAEVIQRLRQCRASVVDSTRPCMNPGASGVHPALLRLCERCKCPRASPECGASPDTPRLSPRLGIDCDISSGHRYYEAVAEMILDTARALDYVRSWALA